MLLELDKGAKQTDRIKLETAVLNLAEIELLFEMYRETLIGRSWTEIDQKQLDKMEYGFYMLQEQFAAKKEAIESAFYGTSDIKATETVAS